MALAPEPRHRTAEPWRPFDDADFDDCDPAYLTFEDYQKIADQEQQLANSSGSNDDDDALNAMALIRMSVLVAENATAAGQRSGNHVGDVATADEILQVMHETDVEREITRALRRSGIDGERHGPKATLSMKLTRKSAYGPAPTQLTVAGLRNIVIEDSYFMASAKETMLMERKQVAIDPVVVAGRTSGSVGSAAATNGPKRVGRKGRFVSPKERYVQHAKRT